MVHLQNVVMTLINRIPRYLVVFMVQLCIAENAGIVHGQINFHSQPIYDKAIDCGRTTGNNAPCL